MSGKQLIPLWSKSHLLTSREIQKQRNKGGKCVEAKAETGVTPTGTRKHPVLVQSTLGQEDLGSDHSCAMA